VNTELMITGGGQVALILMRFDPGFVLRNVGGRKLGSQIFLPPRPDGGRAPPISVRKRRRPDTDAAKPQPARDFRR
jgi:hypothetical protein